MRYESEIKMQKGDIGFLVDNGRIVELQYNGEWCHDDGHNIIFTYKYVKGGYHFSSYDELFKVREDCRSAVIARLDSEMVELY